MVEVSKWLLSWVYPVEVLQPHLGSEGEQHILASSAQAATSRRAKVFLWTWCLKTGMQVAQNDCRANVHLERQVFRYFQPSSPFYGRSSGQ